MPQVDKVIIEEALEIFEDNEKRGLGTASERGLINKMLSKEPIPEGVYAPITTAMPADLAPIAYVLHNYTTKCLGCEAEHKHSDIFALNHLRSRTGMTYVRNMTPVSKLEWNVPLQIHTLTTKTIPACFACVDQTMAHLKTLRNPPVPNLTRPAPTVASVTKAAKTKAAKTIDDILDF